MERANSLESSIMLVGAISVMKFCMVSFFVQKLHENP